MKERFTVGQILLLAIILLASLIHMNVTAPDGVSIVNLQLQPFGDAYVTEYYPDMNPGSDKGLLVQSYLTSDARVFIVFDLRSVPPGSHATYTRLFPIHV